MKGNDHEDPEGLEEWSWDYNGAPERADRFLCAQFPDLSRSLLQRWIADGLVTIDGQTIKSSQTIRPGQRIVVTPPEPSPANDWVAEPMDLDLVAEDDSILVVNKPAGLVVHPAAGHASGTLVNGLMAHCPGIGQVPRSGLVHRLDRDTTGLMVVAKTIPAQVSLVAQLQERSVSRQYLALVWGVVSAQTLDTFMGRDPKDRQRMAVLPEGKGKHAITHVKPLAKGELFGMPVTLVRCRLETGRTHQIRVHLEHIQHPLVGDRTYTRHAPHASRIQEGAKRIQETLVGQALHAQRLSLRHPTSNQLVTWSINPPPAFMSVLGLAGISERAMEVSDDS
jgi:23S rRNA pseudouridine1911/1915/1917 synthase